MPQRSGGVFARGGADIDYGQQGQRDAGLHFADGALAKQVGEMACLVNAEDEEDLVAAVDPDVLARSRRSRFNRRLLAPWSANAQS